MQSYLVQLDSLASGKPGVKEYSFSTNANGFGVMIDGYNIDFTESILKFLSRTNIDDKNLKLFQNYGIQFSKGRVAFKVDFSLLNIEKATIYFMQNSSVDQIMKLMMLQEMAEETLQKYRLISKILQCNELYYWGVRCKNLAHPTLKFSFRLEAEHHTEQIRTKFLKVFETFASFSNYSFALFNSVFQEFGKSSPLCSSIYISFYLSNHIQPLIKIDYKGVPIKTILKVMRDFAMDTNQAMRLEQLGTLFKTDCVDYCGCLYGDALSPVFKYYFTSKLDTQNVFQELKKTGII